MQNVKNFLLAVLLLQCFLCFSQQEERIVADTLPYPARYTKLKDLYLKRIETESYKSAQEIQIKYFDKMYPESADMQDFIKLGGVEWAKTHIYKTEFGSAEQIEREWKVVEEAFDKDIKENREYHKYHLTCLVAGFYDIDQKIQEEVKKEHPEKFPVRAYKKKETYIPKISITPK